MAAHHLDENIDIGATRKGDGVGFPGIAGQVGIAVLLRVTRRNGGDLDAAARAGGDQVGLGLDDLDDADANGAKTGKAKTQRGGHGETYASERAVVC